MVIESKAKLLKGQVLIDRYQHIEMLTDKGPQFSILECRPPHLASRLDLMPSELTGQTPVDTFVEPHEAVAII